MARLTFRDYFCVTLFRAYPAVFILQPLRVCQPSYRQRRWLCEETRWRRKNYFHTYYYVGGMGWWRKQAPSWNEIVKKFNTNNDVVFGDINLSENRVRQIHGEAKPWKRGWPTIRYFNKETGYGGKPYSKRLAAHVWRTRRFITCRLMSRKWARLLFVVCLRRVIGCNEKESKYITKMSSKTQAESRNNLIGSPTWHRRKWAPRHGLDRSPY